MQCHGYDTGKECRIDGKKGDDGPQKRGEVRVFGVGFCLLLFLSLTAVVINYNFWQRDVVRDHQT